MKPTSPDHSVAAHFEGRAPIVRAIYDRLLAAARSFGPFTEAPKKTSIHLDRETAFAGVATRKDALILTVKSATDIASPRVSKRERTSTSRWHVEFRLDAPAQVDRELSGFLRAAYELSGPKATGAAPPEKTRPAPAQKPRKVAAASRRR